MKQRKIFFSKLFISSFVLLLIVLLIKFIPPNNDFIEKYYSTLFYVKISVFLRTITNRIPFSLGDFLYLIAAIYCLIKLIQYVCLAFKKKITANILLPGLIRIIRLILITYIIFNILWGLNYKRTGIFSQLQIEPQEYNTGELKQLTADLVKKVNEAYSSSNMYAFRFQSYKTVFADAINSYKNISYRYPFLSYYQPCIKTGMINGLDNYFGIVGYFNPFTAEAEINTSIPHFLLPYIITHEIAHQLGYAGEDEANFVAYFVSKNSYENAFRYSAYFSLFNYANRQLLLQDSASAQTNYKGLDSLVKIDETIYMNFISNNSGFGAHYSTTIYNDYLKLNDQSKGMEGYNAVISILIAYEKRYGDL